MPMIRRVPKRGFNNRWAKTIVVVNLSQLNAAFNAGDEITPEVLKAKNIARGHFDEVKILGDGNLTKKLKISAHRFSKSAEEKIAKAGAEMVVLEGKTPVAQKQREAKERRAQASS